MNQKPSLLATELQAALATLVYDPDKLRTPKDAAEYMGNTTEGAVKALIKRGELRSVQIGTGIFIAQSAIHEFIERSHKAQENERYRLELVGKRKS